MTLQQFRDETENLPGDIVILWHDGFNQELEPASLFLFKHLRPGDPLRLKMSPQHILISGCGEEVPC
jgi:hypothetical protein